MVKVLDQLDIIGQDESHELMGLIDIISQKISSYDDAHIESILSNRDRKTLKGINSLPNTSDDFSLIGELTPSLKKEGIINNVSLKIHGIKGASGAFPLLLAFIRLH
ncbi:hypothetical protein SCN92_12665 [Legionella pneumophila serogroup 1]